ncbi:LysR family transcriptional regulator [Pseudoduganella armeniaca]|uniref:LysR family transcriptional regulator n=1 Tax=Pseudoduganella armeniaca TaxID=2072590 RepID=UPI0015E769BE|nr:LysR family transcriptional regulator [Pseudoduganella armeniaca]
MILQFQHEGPDGLPEPVRAFARVVEIGSFARAADTLALPRNTLTKLVQHLRIKLLNRSRRRVEVATDGQALGLLRAHGAPAGGMGMATPSIGSAGAGALNSRDVEDIVGAFRPNVLVGLPHQVRRIGYRDVHPAVE